MMVALVLILVLVAIVGSGGSSDSNSGGSSNNGGSSNDNSNNNDNGDKGPPGPSTEDTKDLVSDDKPSPPVACADSCSAPDENGNVHNVPVGEQPTIVDLTHGPIHQCHGLCIPPKPPVNQIVKINIILKIIHKGSHGHSGSSPSQTHGLSDACYVAMKQAWSGSIHVGQNAEIDKFMAGCLV